MQHPTGFVLGNEHAVGYGYDVSGRLATLSAQGLPNLPGKSHAFEYTYEPGSSLLDKVTGPVHDVDNTYETYRDVLLQKTNTRTVGTPAELSVIGYTVNAIGQREQRNLSGEIRADFHGGQSTDLYATDWGNDALRQVIVRYEYDPFCPSTRFACRFSTKPRDPATGLYYYGFRWFDPYAGRWPSRDPIEESGGVNLYHLAHNSSMGSIDVLGMGSVDIVLYDGKDKTPHPPGGRSAQGEDHRIAAHNPSSGFEIKIDCQDLKKGVEQAKAEFAKMVEHFERTKNNWQNTGYPASKFGQTPPSVRMVAILDHGGIGSQNLGDKSIDPFSYEVVELGGLIMERHGYILLCGCDVANGDDGKGYLEDFAAVSGVNVTAGQGTQYSRTSGSPDITNRVTVKISEVPLDRARNEKAMWPMVFRAYKDAQSAAKKMESNMKGPWPRPAVLDFPSISKIE